MKKILRMCLVTVLSLTFLASCSNDDKDTDLGENEKELIGIILPTKDEPRWLQDEEKFKELISKTDYRVEIMFSQGSSAIEKQNIENLITKEADIIIITAHDGTVAAASVEEAKAAGIRVIAYDRLVTDTDAVDYYVTFDSVSVGEAQGNYLIEQAGDRTGLPLYLYAGAASDNNAFLFFEGAWNVLQPKIEDGTFVIVNSSEAKKLREKLKLSREEQSQIIGQVTTNWDFDEAKKKAEAHLTNAKTDEKGEVFILAPNDGTARSIADVFNADAEITNLHITGQDAELPSIQYIMQGKQSMSVFKDVRILANDTINLAVDILSGKDVNVTKLYNNGVIDVLSITTDVQIITKDNVEEILIDTGYYTEEEVGL